MLYKKTAQGGPLKRSFPKFFYPIALQLIVARVDIVSFFRRNTRCLAKVSLFTGQLQPVRSGHKALLWRKIHLRGYGSAHFKP